MSICNNNNNVYDPPAFSDSVGSIKTAMAGVRMIWPASAVARVLRRCLRLVLRDLHAVAATTGSPRAVLAPLVGY